MDICKRCKKFSVIDKGFTRCSKCRKERNKQAKRYYRKWHDESTNPERTLRIKRRNRNATLKRQYGITIEDFDKMFAEQKGLCGICRNEMTINSKRGWGGKHEVCVDHNHQTGKVRGLLCRGCNLQLSMIEDMSFRKKATQYLSKLEK
jgi:hypothetical protein